MTPSDCSTQFFRFQLNDRGRPGALTQVGPTLPGDLTRWPPARAAGSSATRSTAAAARKQASSGATSGCSNLGTGRTRQWTDAPAYLTQLSMSANGRLLAFSETLTKPAPGSGNGGFEITGYQVRALATDAAPGPVDGRSRVAASISPQDSHVRPADGPPLPHRYVVLPVRGTVRPSQAGGQEDHGHGQDRRLPDRHREGRPGWSPPGPRATSTANTATPRSALSCSSMALDPSGRYLLVPYRQTFAHPGDQSSSGSLTAARINTATGASPTGPSRTASAEARAR